MPPRHKIVSVSLQYGLPYYVSLNLSSVISHLVYWGVHRSTCNVSHTLCLFISQLRHTHSLVLSAVQINLLGWGPFYTQRNASHVPRVWTLKFTEIIFQCAHYTAAAMASRAAMSNRSIFRSFSDKVIPNSALIIARLSRYSSVPSLSKRKFTIRG